MGQERPGDGKERRARELHASGKADEFTGLVPADAFWGAWKERQLPAGRDFTRGTTPGRGRYLLFLLVGS